MISLPPSYSDSKSARVSEVSVASTNFGAGGLTGIVAAIICDIGEKNDQPLTFLALNLNLKISPLLTPEASVNSVSRLSFSKPITETKLPPIPLST